MLIIKVMWRYRGRNSSLPERRTYMMVYYLNKIIK